MLLGVLCVGLAPGQPGIAAGAQPQMVSTGASGQRLPFTGLPAATPGAARPVQPVRTWVRRRDGSSGTLKLQM